MLATGINLAHGGACAEQARRTTALAWHDSPSSFTRAQTQQAIEDKKLELKHAKEVKDQNLQYEVRLHPRGRWRGRGCGAGLALGAPASRLQRGFDGPVRQMLDRQLQCVDPSACLILWFMSGTQRWAQGTVRDCTQPAWR